MSHIHIPDGVLPIWLVAAGWVVTAILLAVAVWRLRRGDLRRQVPLLGVMAAVMLVGMSTELVPIAYHLNLSILAGIVLGPVLGFLAAFVVDLILAMFGHGGITVVGLNTLLIGVECALGWAAFRVFLRLLSRGSPSPFRATFLATIVTLAVSTTLLVGVVALGNIDPGRARETGSLNAATLSFSNPFSHGVIANRIVKPEGVDAGGSGSWHDRTLGLGLFVGAVYILGVIGWLLEAAVTSLIVAFVYRVRRDLVWRSRSPERSPTEVGKELL